MGTKHCLTCGGTLPADYPSDCCSSGCASEYHLSNLPEVTDEPLCDNWADYEDDGYVWEPTF